MGIHGIYKEIGAGQRIALSKLAVEKFEETGRPLRIAIDTSIWLFQIQASKGGTNPALRTFYYRLLRMIALSIHPIFVFDGPNRPPFKRNKRTGPNVASIPEFLAKQLLKQFGFPIHLAPGEAEAECALLQREGIVDAVLSEDVDTLMFGSGITIRNWSPEQKTSKTPTHVNVYDAVKTKNGPSGLDREGMILVALMSGGDYVPEGIPGCGPKTACEAARAGFGRDLCEIAPGDSRALQRWRDRLQHELKTNESKLFKRKHTTLKIPADFPRADILGYYTHPAISTQAGLDKLRRSIKWDQDLDFQGLRDFTYDAFDWVKLEGAKHFIRSLAPSLLVHRLRLRAEQQEQTPITDLQAIQEDEALLVKGLHGKRQHIVTDHSTEIRVSFTPIELVKINLDQEEPDEEPQVYAPLGDQLPEADLDDEVPLEIDEDAESGSRKRGPTKFDPHKPARVWVLETFVKIGVPLKIQDWESERQIRRKPKQPVTAQQNGNNTAGARGTRQTKSATIPQQVPIERFAKVRKPGVRSSRTLGKTQNSPSAHPAPISQPASKPANEVIDLLSSPPMKATHDTIQSQRARDISPPSTIGDLPASVTKRRRRRPMQRSQTLPADTSTIVDRSTTPPPMDTIETLDLIDPPLMTSPSQIAAKRTKTRPLRTCSVVRTNRDGSVASSPGRTRQTTLDTWRASATPTNARYIHVAVEAAQLPAPPRFQAVPEDVDTLDLTLSSPRISSPRCTSRRATTKPTTRITLAAISPNASHASIHLRSDEGGEDFSKTAQGAAEHTQHYTDCGPRTGPSSPVIETLDLTELSSPAPSAALRRSPRHHSSPEPLPVRKPPSPPAAWKIQAKKKREVILRKSLAGAWDFVDAESPRGKAAQEIPKGKERRRWRESEIEILDLS